MAVPLIYLNFKFLQEPRIYGRLKGLLPIDNYISYCDYDLAHDAVYNRAGQNTLDWHDTISTVMNCRVPDFDNSFDQDFAEVTNQRCIDLIAQRSDKPWAVLWSGGIDSTVMVCSLISNLTDSEKQSVTILCDIGSITENPGFFHSQIRPNFRIDSIEKVLDYYDKHLVLGGEMGDCLFAHRYSGLLKRIDLADRPWARSTDEMIEFISFAGNTTVDFARWIWERLTSNVQSVDVPVETCRDIFWWMGFNWLWIPTAVRFQRRTNLPMKVWKDRHVHWFDNTAYQQWAMHNNNTGEKNGPEPWQQKYAAKSYIHALDQNNHYFQHKLKVNSGGRRERRDENWLGLDANLVQYHACDIENILENIQAHCCSRSGP